MVDVVILGTVALDSVETPFGKVDNVLGGSASYAATAARFFATSGIVSIVGKDFPTEYWDFLKTKADLDGIHKDKKTFRWEGSYEFDMNDAKTIKTELNALEVFDPVVPASMRDAPFVFLANVDPVLQLKVLEQMKNVKLSVLDTMNLWIEHKKKDLLKVIKKVDTFVLNDGEARQLFETANLVKAARKALSLGPEYVIIKKGEHGALLFTNGTYFNCPGYPLETIRDPTGCGDSFGGGFIGYLAKTKHVSEPNLRKAIVHGSVIASYNAEDFSLNRLKGVGIKDIEGRYKEFQNMGKF